MRDEKATVDYTIEPNGTINFSCEVPLTDDEVEEFKRVLSQGSAFLSPSLGENSISYFHSETYDSKEEAERRLQGRLETFAEGVRSRTEITLIGLNLTISIP